MTYNNNVISVFSYEITEVEFRYARDQSDALPNVIRVSFTRTNATSEQ